MAGSVEYTRSLTRRFLAYVIDFVIASLLATIVVAILGLITGNQYRLSTGLVYFTSCDHASSVFGPDGESLSLSEFTSVQVCTTTTNFFIQDRHVSFMRKTEGANSGTSVSWSKQEEVSFPVDAQNRAISPVYLDFAFWLILILGAAAFESSRLQASPGKLLQGLAVRSATSETASPKAALVRNLLKNSWVLYGILDIYLSRMFLDDSQLFQNGKVIIPHDFWEQLQLSLLVTMAIALLMIVIVIGLFMPWNKAGRGLYDKLAGTFVIRRV